MDISFLIYLLANNYKTIEALTPITCQVARWKYLNIIYLINFNLFHFICLCFIEPHWKQNKSITMQVTAFFFTALCTYFIFYFTSTYAQPTFAQHRFSHPHRQNQTIHTESKHTIHKANQKSPMHSVHCATLHVRMQIKLISLIYITNYFFIHYRIPLRTHIQISTYFIDCTGWQLFFSYYV